MGVGRRGKYVVVDLESDRHLLVHLRMTGSFRTSVGGFLEDDPHLRAVATLDDGSDVAYRDVRRFGTWHVLGGVELTSYLAARLGPEPLERGFTAAALEAILAERRAPVKAVLLDQRRLAGVGNIYADEALWRASTRAGRQGRSSEPRSRPSTGESGPRCRPELPARARPCAITAIRPEPRERCRTSFASTTGPACRACDAGRRSRKRGLRAAERGSVRGVRRTPSHEPVPPRGRAGRKLVRSRQLDGVHRRPRSRGKRCRVRGHRRRPRDAGERSARAAGERVRRECDHSLRW